MLPRATIPRQPPGKNDPATSTENIDNTANVIANVRK